MRYQYVFFTLGAFILGILSTLILIESSLGMGSGSQTTYTTYTLSRNLDTESVEKGSSEQEQIELNLLARMGLGNEEKPSPYNWISEGDIHVYKDKVVIDISNAEWATFTDTNSMDPVLDFGANAIEIIPNSPQDIHVGDIVSYELSDSHGTIIHRVIETGFDEEGWYMRTRGDNNPRPDPSKIRFEQVRRIVVALIY
ncbi:hypothetical protein JW930_03075 [Candidatus Woesearchaeota archaeon]|nr:hypothetical protein [Candidatus Woesearchaeota archaeon]